MSTILLDDVETGAILAADVADRNGRVLLKAGVCLNEKHIRTLRTWGVLEVNIEGDDIPTQADNHYPESWLTEANEHAVEHFRHCPLDHPFVSALIDCWKLRYLKQKES